MRNILYIVIPFILFGCLSSPVKEQIQDQVQITQPKDGLAWGHKDWDAVLFNNINVSVFDKASDIAMFCPNWKNLSQEKKLTTIGVFYVELSRRESGWNTNDTAVDVGTADNKNSWSIGLFQMSVDDQESYNLHYGFNYDDLLKAENNIKLATAIMEQNISKYGSITMRKNVYWAPLKISGKYDQIDGIVNAVKAKADGCL